MRKYIKTNIFIYAILIIAIVYFVLLFYPTNKIEIISLQEGQYNIEEIPIKNLMFNQVTTITQSPARPEPLKNILLVPHNTHTKPLLRLLEDYLYERAAYEIISQNCVKAAKIDSIVNWHRRRLYYLDKTANEVINKLQMESIVQSKNTDDSGKVEFKVPYGEYTALIRSNRLTYESQTESNGKIRVFPNICCMVFKSFRYYAVWTNNTNTTK
jgi:hypothetical protein